MIIGSLQKNIIRKISARCFSTKPFNYQILQLDQFREELRSSAEKFSIENLEPIADKVDKENNFPREIWNKMGD